VVSEPKWLILAQTSATSAVWLGMLPLEGECTNLVERTHILGVESGVSVYKYMCMPTIKEYAFINSLI